MTMQTKISNTRNGIFILALLVLVMSLILLRFEPAAALANTHIARGKVLILHGRLLGGGKLNTAQWKGKVIVVDFWGTWCPWCLKQSPYIEKIYQKYHGHGLEVVGIPVLSTAAAVHQFARKHPKADWPEIFNKNPGNGALAQKLGISGFPTEFIIDQKGVLRHIIVGYSPRELVADVKALLKTPANDN